MLLAPRLLYGLHERFVLIPYEIGAKKSRLVLRATHLRRFCLHTLKEPAISRLGAPFVLGEILEYVGRNVQFVPIVRSGEQLDALKGDSVKWALRSHRAVPMLGRSLRFESGTKLNFAQHTSFYSIELLLVICAEDIHEEKPRTGVP